MKICLITGSTLGGAEYVAEHVESLLQQQGFETQLEHGAEFDQVKDENIWLVITSTHGAGEVPDNLQPFVASLKEDKPNLSALRFGVIGLGNTDYDTFCYAAVEVEKLLLDLGAQAICPLLKIDVANVDDPDQEAENWLPQFVDNL